VRLHNKIAVITGGNSGIGLGIAEAFSSEGAKGIIFGRNAKTLKKAKIILDPQFEIVQGDVTRMDDLDRLYFEIDRQFGGIDILVVNAGGGKYTPFEETTEKDFDDMVNINFKGAFFTVQKAIPFLNSGAKIILISSMAHHKGFSNCSVYAACKAAVRSLTRTLSTELLPYGVYVNTLTPGPIDTPIYDRVGICEDDVTQVKESFEQLVPLKRMGTPLEMGRIAVFLASSDSDFIVGEEIIADGGVVNL